MEEVLARQSSWEDMDVCGIRWNYMEARGSERRSSEASAEALLDAFTEASTGSIRGNLAISHREWKLSTASVDHAAGGSFHVSDASCWKLPWDRGKLQWK